MNTAPENGAWGDSKVASPEAVLVVYEDAEVIAVNKPPGLAVHPDGKSEFPTLVDFVQKYRPEIIGVGEPMHLSDGREIARPGIVHRIDRETSGILLIAKTEEAFQFLKKAFQERRVKKIYNAFVHGTLPEERGNIALPIGRSRKNFRQWIAVEKGASADAQARGVLRDAETDYRVLQSSPKFSFVEVSPKTGRTHQIRVHFKALRHPIVCDTLYAKSRPCALGFSRLALHALSLELLLPSGARAKLETPLPGDFERALLRMAEGQTIQ